MIRIMNQTPEPELFGSEEFQAFRREIEAFHRAGGSRKSQTRAPEMGQLEEFFERVRPDMRSRFRSKCAYTESPLDEPGSGVLTLHRPAADAIGFHGELSPDHYWWLITDWSNWRLASRTLESVKGTQFPVAGRRAPRPHSKREERIRDRGILLDPLTDEPAWWLGFDDTGQVYSRRHPSLRVRRYYTEPGERHKRPGSDEWEKTDTGQAYDRGEVTIRLLDLNAQHLQEERREYLESRVDWRESWIHGAPYQLWEMIKRTLPYAAMQRGWFCRRLLANWQNERQLDMDPDILSDLAVEITAHLLETDLTLPMPLRPILAPVREVIERHHPEVAETETFRTHFETKEEGARRTRSAAMQPPERTPSLSAAAPEPEPEAPAEETGPVIVRSMRLAHVEIQNFKAIRRVTLDFNPTPVHLLPRYGDAGSDAIDVTGWKALLGENGSGKSCVLEAVGLALSGQHLPRIEKDGEIDWPQILRRPAPGSDETVTEGSIKITFTGSVEIELHFDADGARWVGPAPQVHAFVRGYGATRLLDRAVDLDDLSRTVRVANLYNPKSPVTDAKGWLLDLGEGDFQVAALTLQDLLSGADLDLRQNPADPADAAPDDPRDDTVRPKIERDLETKEVRIGGDPLELVSDGYRAVVSIVCDIIAGLGTGMSDLRNARGIVLIDELGAHLHPTWRMTLTESLRRTLPNVQFLVSTHEPLCLRGLHENEVVRVKKTQDQGVQLERIPDSPSRYRVDQLLTSEFFGLQTTFDPDLERRYRVYYRLLALPTPTENQRREIAELRAYFRDHTNPVLGHSRRDQMIYEAIDGFLKDAESLDPETRRERRTDTLRSIREIWQRRRETVAR